MIDQQIQNNKLDSQLGQYLFLIISTLVCFGALMVYSAGASLDQNIDVKYFWRYMTARRVVFVPIVLLILSLVSRKGDYRKYLIWQNNFWCSPIAILLAIAAILLVVVLWFGTEVNNSRRWLVVGPSEFGIRIQPSELAKWVVVMFLAGYCARRGPAMRRFWSGFVPPCLILLMIVALIGVEDFGTAALVASIGVVVLLAGGIRWYHLLLLIPIAGLAFYILVYSNDYRWARVMAFWQADSSGKMASAYQAQQSLMAIGSGGLWGAGLGNGTVKLGWLPEDTTDFVFAVIGEELGFVGCAIVIGLFASLVYCGALIIRKTPAPTAKLLALAITSMIGGQALMNLAVVTGLAPTKGIALPFISAGGSGLVITALAAGLLINIAHTSPNQSAPSPL